MLYWDDKVSGPSLPRFLWGRSWNLRLRVDGEPRTADEAEAFRERQFLAVAEDARQSSLGKRALPVAAKQHTTALVDAIARKPDREQESDNLLDRVIRGERYQVASDVKVILTPVYFISDYLYKLVLYRVAPD
jgi:hypothetical protein